MINPPSFFLTDDKVFFSLGLLSIAGVLEQAGHTVKLFDLAGRDNYLDLAKGVAEHGYDLYGLTATSPQFSYATNILNAIKSVNSNSHVIIGGPHATMFADLRKKRLQRMSESAVYDSDPNFISLELFDRIVEGEELGILEAMKRIDQNGDKWLYTGILEDHLDKLPFLPRHLIDNKSYLWKDDGTPKFDIDGGPATSIISQRGCPFGCNFCSGRNVDQFRNVNSASGNKRAFSPKRIVDELNYINQEFGVTGFMFYDDELNLRIDTTLDLMRALEENNKYREKMGEHPYVFRGFVKSELFVKHPEVAPAMRRAGFTEILSGFESGSDRILRNYVRKHTTVKTNYECAKLALQNGIRIKALTMVGQPTETLDDIMMTQEHLESIGKLSQEYGVPWQFDVTVLTPLPGSPIYDWSIPNGGRFREEFSRVLGDGELYSRRVDFAVTHAPYKTAPGENEVHIRTKTLSAKDLLELRDQVDATVRRKFNVAGYERDAPQKDIEHSMGQS